MRQLFAIGMMTVYLLSQTEFHQLVKIPLLLEHYVEHRTESPEMSFLDFLAMHYLHGSPQDHDFAKDQRLPFKSSDCNTVAIPAVLPTTEITLPAWIYFTDRIQEALHAEPVRSRASAEIWQPPRHV